MTATRTRKRTFRLLVLFMMLMHTVLFGSASTAALAEPEAKKPVLIYDVSREQIVGVFPNSAEIRQEAAKWIKQAGEVSGKLKIGFNSGIIIRIPFEPRLPVTQAKLSYECRDLFVIIPSAAEAKEKPQLVAFSAEDQAYVYECSFKQIKKFLKKHDLMHWLDKPSGKAAADISEARTTFSDLHD